MHRLEADYWGQIDFVYIDAEHSDNKAVRQRYDVYSHPVFILIEPDGTVVQRWIGSVDESEFRAAFNAYLLDAPQ